MKKTIAGLFLIAFPLIFSAQAAAPIATLANIPGIATESSGIEQIGPNRFLTHNDSGGQPELYEFDSSGVLVKTIKITNATNVDWEELTQDDSNHVYIGDFGNNNNNRSAASGNGLKIYKINNPALLTGTTTTASVINFEYCDRNFSAPASNHNFDMESFFWYKDSLHLFSKNRTNPTTGWCKHYVLPAAPGTYTAMLVDSFNNGGIRITSADLSPNKHTVALLANDHIYLFQCFKGTRFVSTSSSTTLTLPNTQKEAIVFINDSVVFMTDEKNGSTPNHLYRSNLRSYIYKPIAISSLINNTCPGNSNGSIALTPSGGVGPFTYNWSNSATSATDNFLAAGNYSVTISDSKGCSFTSNYTVPNFTVATPVITQSGTTLVSNISSGNQWYLNSGLIPFQTGNTLTPPSSGSYYTTVTDANGCTVNSNTITISVTGIDELNASKETIACFYNGTSYVLQNKTDFSVGIILTNTIGQLLYEKELAPGETASYESPRQLILFRAENKSGFQVWVKRY